MPRDSTTDHELEVLFYYYLSLCWSHSSIDYFWSSEADYLVLYLKRFE